MLHHRNPPKGMTSEMLRRPQHARHNRRELIRCALLFQGGEDGAPKRTAGNGMDDEFRHHALLKLGLPSTGCDRPRSWRRLALCFLQVALHETWPSTLNVLAHRSARLGSHGFEFVMNELDQGGV